MGDTYTKDVVFVVLLFVGHAHSSVSELHGNYFVDDYIGIWTEFDGIGAISGGGVCVPFY